MLFVKHVKRWMLTESHYARNNESGCKQNLLFFKLNTSHEFSNLPSCLDRYIIVHTNSGKTMFTWLWSDHYKSHDRSRRSQT